MTVTIERENDDGLDFDYETVAKEVIAEAVTFEKFPYEIEVNLLLVDDEEIRNINKLQRDIDKATDVLSFPMIEYPEAGDYSEIDEIAEFSCNLDTGELVLGDIIISVPRVIAQAEEYGHSILREYAFLITHSMLHLFGYDHMEPEEAAIMENKQKAILTKMNITR